MIRKKVRWSSDTDSIEGPCLVCQGTVYFVIPRDRVSPTFLYHATCDPMTQIRQHLKTVEIPLLAPEFTLRKPLPTA